MADAGDVADVEACLARLQDQEASVRAEACYAVACVGKENDEHVICALCNLLGDCASDVVIKCIGALSLLAEISYEIVVRKVRARFESMDDLTRNAALRALNRLPARFSAILGRREHKDDNYNAVGASPKRRRRFLGVDG